MRLRRGDAGAGPNRTLATKPPLQWTTDESSNSGASRSSDYHKVGINNGGHRGDFSVHDDRANNLPLAKSH